MIESQVNIISYLIMLIGALVSIVSFFLIRTLRQIDSNQRELYERLHKVEVDLACLMGEHKAMSTNIHSSKGG